MAEKILKNNDAVSNDNVKSTVKAVKKPRGKSKKTETSSSSEVDETNKKSALNSNNFEDGEDGEVDSEPEIAELAEAEILEYDLEQEIEHELKLRAQADFDAQGTNSDVVRDYLINIGQINLLSHDQEKDYARRIEVGLYANKILTEHADELDDDMKHDLKWITEDGRHARHRLTEANLRLVVSLARRYSSRSMRFQDLIQEGNNGLARAVDKYDYSKTFRFSTYATWWIRQSITRAIADQGRTIRIPVHMVEVINRTSKVTKALTIDLGREPTNEEIAREMGITIDRVIEIHRYSREVTSIYAPIGTEGETVLGDLVVDTSEPEHYERASTDFTRDKLFNILNMLNDKERKVIVLRSGLNDGVCHTLDEVGRLLGLTRERIRQIEQRAMDKLSHAAYSNGISDMIEGNGN